jgi:hypothetical protein
MEDYVDNDAFPDSVVDDVDGLIWLGYLEDVVEFCGHEFVIRTLRADEVLLSTLITKEYAETIGQGKAWVAAQIALALVSVDGDEEFCPRATHNKKDYARARFNYVTSNWYEATINHIYQSYATLLDRQALAIEETENLSKESRITFTASPDSLTPKDASQAAREVMEILESEDQEDSTPFKKDF